MAKLFTQKYLQLESAAQASSKLPKMLFLTFQLDLLPSYWFGFVPFFKSLLAIDSGLFLAKVRH